MRTSDSRTGASMHPDRPLQQRRAWRGWSAPGRALALAAAMVLTAGALPLAAGPAQALATGCPVGAVQSGTNCVMQFSASGTWTVPAGITSVHFFVVGGGGGGGTAYIDAGTSKKFGGGGGGGGGVGRDPRGQGRAELGRGSSPRSHPRAVALRAAWLETLHSHRSSPKRWTTNPTIATH